jgi:hypothetical protein
MLPSIKSMVGSIGGLFAGLAVVDFFKDSIAEARESAKVGRVTEAVLKSTGNAAKVSAGQIGELATRLSNLSGVDDEVIQSGENVLLTYTNVQNQIGKGNDIFNQATQAALDMSAMLGTDLQASITQVGKALQDPIKGITALKKVGVNFTDSQKAQIKTLVSTGHAMDAQKIILAELKKEYGGAAAAAADPAMKASVAWGNFKEMIGGLLLPVLTKMINYFTSVVLPALEQFANGIKGVGTDVGGVAKTLNTLGLGLRAMVLAFQEGDVTSDGFVGKMEQLGILLRGLWEKFKDIVGAIKTTVVWFKEHETAAKALAITVGALTLAYQAHAAYLVVDKAGGLLEYIKTIRIVQFATKLWAAITWVLNGALAVLTSPITLIILGIALLAAAVIYCWFHFSGFRDFLIKIGVSFMEFVHTVVVSALAVKNWAVDLYNSFMKSYHDVADWAVKVYNSFMQFIQTLVNAALAVKDWAVKVYNSFMDFVGKIVALWNLWRDKFVATWNSAKSVFEALVNFILVTVPNAFGKGVDALKKAWDRVQAVAKDPVTFVVNSVINPLILGWNKLGKPFGAPQVDTIKGFASGASGIFPGYTPGRDVHTVPLAAFSGGESVMRPEWTRVVGKATVDMWNRAAITGGTAGVEQAMTGYADGGILDFITSPLNWAKAKVGGAIGNVVSKFGDHPLAKVLVNMGTKLISLVADKAKALFLGGSGGPIGAWPSSPGAQRGDSGVWRSIVALIRSTGPLSGSFGNAYRAGDPLWHGSGRAVDWMGFNQDALASFFMSRRGSVLELIHRTNTRDYAVTRGVDKGSFDNGLMEEHRNHIHIAMKRGGLVPMPVRSFDRGGYLSPGYNLVHNGTGSIEGLRPDGETRLDDMTIRKLAQALSSRPVRVAIEAGDWNLGVAGVAP